MYFYVVADALDNIMSCALNLHFITVTLYQTWLCWEPHGLNVADWDDAAWTSEQLDLLGPHLNVVQTKASYPIVFGCPFVEIKTVQAWMERHGCQDCHPVFWYKPNQNLESAPAFVYAVEVWMVGYKGGRSNCSVNFQSMGLGNPTHRHNCLSIDSVRKYLLDDDGNRVNTTQKPLELVLHLINMYIADC